MNCADISKEDLANLHNEEYLLATLNRLKSTCYDSYKRELYEEVLKLFNYQLCKTAYYEHMIPMRLRAKDGELYQAGDDGFHKFLNDVL
jgi:hypothetical protein